MSLGIAVVSEERLAALRTGLEADLKPLGDRYSDDRLPLDQLPQIVKTLRGHGYPLDEPPNEVAAALAGEELARVFPSLEGCLMVTFACARYIAAAGPPELRERAVPGLLDGSRIGCLASTEPEHGSNNAAQQTPGGPDGEEVGLKGSQRRHSNAGPS